MMMVGTHMNSRKKKYNDSPITTNTAKASLYHKIAKGDSCTARTGDQENKKALTTPSSSSQTAP